MLSIYISTILKTKLSTHCKHVYYCIKRTDRRPFSSVPTAIHDINTNVSKDVIIYKYENPKSFAYMNLFAIVQYVVWAVMGKFAYESYRDTPIDPSKITEETPWYQKINFGEKKFRITLSSIAIFVGTGSLLLIWAYTLKSVRYLILNKGGKHLTFVTYSPFGSNRIMKVPIQFVCCKENRASARAFLPIKVKNKWMHYVLDMKGEFKHPTLFDATAGFYRRWNI